MKKILLIICLVFFIFTAGCGKKDVRQEITEGQALSSIQKYCYANDPSLEGIVDSGEYPAYWDVSSADEHEITVLFRSYTGALIRYYIDPVSGETYVTEFVPGITAEEERTGESLNVRDYLG